MERCDVAVIVESDTVTIEEQDPYTHTMFRYRPESGRVCVGPLDGTGTLVDMELLIAALRAIKTTQDNEHKRKRGK